LNSTASASKLNATFSRAVFKSGLLYAIKSEIMFYTLLPYPVVRPNPNYHPDEISSQNPTTTVREVNLVP
jgi:hypothetical protein